MCHKCKNIWCYINILEKAINEDNKPLSLEALNNMKKYLEDERPLELLKI